MASKPHSRRFQIEHSLNDDQSTQLKQLIADHVQAEIELSWAGDGDPHDRPLIEAQAMVAQLRLHRFIDKLNAANHPQKG